MKKFLAAAMCILLVFVPLLSASAHPGRTDEQGGHDSGTGYHYHHGYSAHDHYDIDGDGIKDCPYEFNDSNTTKISSDYNGTSASSNIANNDKKSKATVASLVTWISTAASLVLWILFVYSVVFPFLKILYEYLVPGFTQIRIKIYVEKKKAALLKKYCNRIISALLSSRYKYLDTRAFGINKFLRYSSMIYLVLLCILLTDKIWLTNIIEDNAAMSVTILSLGICAAVCAIIYLLYSFIRRSICYFFLGEYRTRAINSAAYFLFEDAKFFDYRALDDVIIHAPIPQEYSTLDSLITYSHDLALAYAYRYQYMSGGKELLDDMISCYPKRLFSDSAFEFIAMLKENGYEPL